MTAAFQAVIESTKVSDGQNAGAMLPALTIARVFKQQEQNTRRLFAQL